MDKLRDELDITEELKETDQMQWVRNMNYVRGMAEENIIKEIVYMQIRMELGQFIIGLPYKYLKDS